MKLALAPVAGVAAVGLCSFAFAAPFVPGNLVVSRIGDAGNSLSASNSNPVYLDEFTTAGSATGNSVAMPTLPVGPNFALTIGRTTTSAGQLSRSADGRFLTIAGTDAPENTPLPNSSTAFRGRTVAVVDSSGSFDTTTRFEAPGTTIRSAFSTNGVDIYTTHDAGAGAPSPGGLRYMTLGQTVGSTLLNSTTTNIRTVQAFNGQLYASASTGVGGDYRGVFAVGTGLPTTATTYALLPGMGGNNTGNTDSTYDFFFADSNTAYLCDDDTTAPASGGLQKWSFNGSTWTKLWTLTPSTVSANATGVRSIAGTVDATGGVSLYLITAATTDGNQLIGLADTLGGTTAPVAGFSLLATAPANTSFRGVDFAPIPEPTSLAALVSGIALTLRRRRA